MASNDSSWVADAVADFIHSSIWAAPVHTFIEANCASFDYDDEDDNQDDDNADEGREATSSPRASLEEQMKIHQQYQRLVDALIRGLGQDLSLDQNDLKKVCEIPTTADDSVMIDEPFEQLYAARDFQLFQEMMKRKNLILQLQALVSLQLQWGLLKHSEAGEDLVLSLLLQATASPTRRDSTSRPVEPMVKQQTPEPEEKHHQVNNDEDDDDDDVVVVPQKKSSSPPPSSSSHTKKESQPRKATKQEYSLPSLRRKGGDLDTDWYRNLQQDTLEKDDDDDDDDDDDAKENDQSKTRSTPQTIGAIPEGLLREKLRELTIRAKATVDDETAAAMESRRKFLQQQRDKIVEKQRVERAQDLEQETQKQQQQQQQRNQQQEQTRPSRPQSAAIARKAMANANKQEDEQQPQITDEEIIKRRAMAAKLRSEVVNKR